MTAEERETIILFNEADSTATIETFNKSLISKLNESCEKYPEQFKLLKENRVDGVNKYSIPKKYVKIAAPITRNFTDEQREAMANRLKGAREKRKGLKQEKNNG